MSGIPSVDLAAASRFVAASAFEVTEISGTRVAGHVEVGPDQHTPWGVVHGGLYCTVVESAASIGASAAVADRGQFAVGVNNNTDFLRPMTAGRLDVVAEPIQQGRTLQLCWSPSPAATTASPWPAARCGCRMCRCRTPDRPGQAPGRWAGLRMTENSACGSCRVAGGRAAARGTTRSHRAGRRCGSSSRPWKR